VDQPDRSLPLRRTQERALKAVFIADLFEIGYFGDARSLGVAASAMRRMLPCYSAFQFVIEKPAEPFDGEVRTPHRIFEPPG
jgi:hypothetical protein